MMIMTKKMIAGMMAGAVLLAGGLTYVQASQQENGKHERIECKGQPGMMQPPQMDTDMAAPKIADTFHVNKEEGLEALNDKKDFRNVGHAAMLAKISGKSFKDVLAMKTEDKHWKEIQESLGVTWEQMKEEMNSLTAARMAEHGNVDEGTAKALLGDGYLPQDIEAAAVLAKESGKNIQSVLEMKKINNRWEDIAKSLGVDAKSLWNGKGGFGGPNGMMMPPGGFGDMHAKGGFQGEPPQMPGGEG